MDRLNALYDRYAKYGEAASHLVAGIAGPYVLWGLIEALRMAL